MRALRAHHGRHERDAGRVRGWVHVGQYDRAVVKVVLLCPGQGAQRVGMGKDLAGRFRAARDVFEAVDEALSFPLSRLAWEGPEADLTLTHNAQPAILTPTPAVHAVVRARLPPLAPPPHSLR